MKISSEVFQPNGLIPREYTCDGYDINPPLLIEGVPETAKSLALIMDDPDAPGGTWVHWVLWNIDPSVTRIAPKSAPLVAVSGKTSFGRVGYGGPCPPKTDSPHRYFFKLYALDTTLNLPSGADKTALEQAMEGHILAQAEIIGRYQRE